VIAHFTWEHFHSRLLEAYRAALGRPAPQMMQP
jgi:hypothetical protein